MAETAMLVQPENETPANPLEKFDVVMLGESVYCEVLFAWANYSCYGIFNSIVTLIVCIAVQLFLACIMLPSVVSNDVGNNVNSDLGNLYDVWGLDNVGGGGQEQHNSTWSFWACHGMDWTWQQEHLEDAGTYAETLYSTPKGFWFGAIALLLWYGVITKELFGNWRYILPAVLSYEELNDWLRLDRYTDAAQIRRMGIVIKLIVVLVAMVRVVICAYIAYYGMLFLVYTKSLTDFIMNSIALGFIYDIDEMFFETFVPYRKKMAFSQLEPFALTDKTFAKKLSSFDTYIDNVSLPFTLAATVLAALLVLKPFSTMYVRDMYHKICPPEEA
jgi:hypothetical protein